MVVVVVFELNHLNDFDMAGSGCVLKKVYNMKNIVCMKKPFQIHGRNNLAKSPHAGKNIYNNQKRFLSLSAIYSFQSWVRKLVFRMFKACFDSFWINSRTFETTQNHIWMYNMNLILYTIANIVFILTLFNMKIIRQIYLSIPF